MLLVEVFRKLSAVLGGMFKAKDEENLEPFGGIVGQLEIFGEVGEINADISVLVSEVVVAD